VRPDFIALLPAVFGTRGKSDWADDFARIRLWQSVQGIVQLQSGGPRMTVTSIDDRGYVRTAWFGDAEKEPDHFRLDA
jgi:uncharacterized protein YodC (DUF2158 family)